MRFSELNDTIPYVTGPKKHILSYNPYPNIKLCFPGTHQLDTTPVGGDFVIKITDTNKHWKIRQFKHGDLFEDFQTKRDLYPASTEALLVWYERLIRDDAEMIELGDTMDHLPGIKSQTLLYAVQCLGVAEHRRYAQFESKGGGRFLPFRFSAGIVDGRWSAESAIARQRQGRPGLEALEKVTSL